MWRGFSSLVPGPLSQFFNVGRRKTVIVRVCDTTIDMQTNPTPIIIECDTNLLVNAPPLIYLHNLLKVKFAAMVKFPPFFKSYGVTITD